MAKMKPLPPLELLRQYVFYDAETGKLFALKQRGKIYPGQEIKGRCIKGYRQIYFLGQAIYLHRLAWALSHGVDPYPYQIDHRDRDNTNNRIANLRIATQQQNSQNIGLRRSNKSGVTGVYFVRRANKWNAWIKVEGKTKNLGNFHQFDEAVAARLTAEKLVYGNFAPSRRRA